MFGYKEKQKRVSKVVSLVAPLGGINDTDPLAAMGTDQCIDMLNFFPGNTTLRTRKGYKAWATGMTGEVKTIMTMNLTDDTSKLFAVTDAGIYDISNPIQNPPLAYPLNSGDVSYIQFSNVAGQYLIGCNGVDPAFLYDGTTFITMTQAATPTLPGEISGVDPAQFSYVNSHDGRLWFAQKNSLVLWYLATDAIGGVASPFYIGGSTHRGGKIVDIAIWSFNAGNGLSAKFVVRTSAGEIVVYDGTDPEDILTWSLESVFFASAPVGTTEAYAEFGGDIVMLTRTGLIPLSRLVQGSANSSLYEESLTKNISRTLNIFVNGAGFVNNWSIINVPVLQALVVILPSTAQRGPTQYVMNILSGAWTRFDVPATCGGVYTKRFYFGDDLGNVHVQGTVELDAVNFDGQGGSPVNSSLFSAYNYFDSPGVNKHFKLCRPIFQSASPVSFIVQLNMDYSLRQIPGNPLPPEGGGTRYVWDDAIWDNAQWSQTQGVFRPWTGVTGIGFCAALLMKVQTSDFTSFPAIEFVYEEGGAI